MQYQNYEKWSDLAKRVQEPFQAIAELNIKTIQSLNYLKPEELAQIKNPEELVEKQVNLVVENGHKALDYMQKSFKILENAMVGFVKETKKNVAAAAKK
ncbi:phasin family protein [Legionella sp. km772]|uniref:phasin family protein n=1 Tax=Legionella sp. km772 TaxID=2498111 RepID=UPI000F8C93BD|nr:phasin family protein [Legionella sp. km772]RUR08674.1 phasin family protein [Legionella sp. km772]